MSLKRSDDTEDRYYFRSKRFYNINGEWFFDTREGAQHGPYRDREQAEKELAIFLARKLSETDDDVAISIGADHGSQDGVVHMVEEIVSYLRYQRNNGRTSTLAWANSRLKDLMDDYTDREINAIRHDALKYVIEHD